ncbi:YciI family protein [Denitrobaculum tricleocarpae]|uniref:YciI family protein n=1 Tax=Denitrobaculum tricleocarpae TaxID=2591009 RepID=A0A545TR83_9PROT|nr:YciI family protein [Denitrobaculum tricleocarpae]TQV79737.1 YciI family protein [Denitrobaculum tricleocarpae]
MYYVISCVDKAGHAHVRAENRPAHVDYLKANIDHIVMAGPTTSEDGEAMTGSVLIMEYDSLADAQAFADGDPYKAAELFESVTIRPWKKVLPA